MKKSMGLCLVVIGFAFLTFNIQPIMGAGEYPSKPIQMLVAYRAGGTTDTMARMLAKPVGDILGQPVVVVALPDRYTGDVLGGLAAAGAHLGGAQLRSEVAGSAVGAGDPRHG